MDTVLVESISNAIDSKSILDHHLVTRNVKGIIPNLIIRISYTKRPRNNILRKPGRSQSHLLTRFVHNNSKFDFLDVSTRLNTTLRILIMVGMNMKSSIFKASTRSHTEINR